MPDCFISYSHYDQDLAAFVREELSRYSGSTIGRVGARAFCAGWAGLIEGGEEDR